MVRTNQLREIERPLIGRSGKSDAPNAANEDGFGTDDGRRAEAGHERALMDA
jgi:hypothetical protein